MDFVSDAMTPEEVARRGANQDLVIEESWSDPTYGTTVRKYVKYTNGWEYTFEKRILPDYTRWAWNVAGPDGYFFDEADSEDDAIAMIWAQSR